jgi:hypothetical protein
MTLAVQLFLAAAFLCFTLPRTKDAPEATLAKAF